MGPRTTHLRPCDIFAFELELTFRDIETDLDPVQGESTVTITVARGQRPILVIEWQDSSGFALRPPSSARNEPTFTPYREAFKAALAMLGHG